MEVDCSLVFRSDDAGRQSPGLPGRPPGHVGPAGRSGGRDLGPHQVPGLSQVSSLDNDSLSEANVHFPRKKSGLKS